MESKEYKMGSLVMTINNDGKTKKRYEVNYPLYAQCYGEALDAIFRNIEYNNAARERRKRQERDLGVESQERVEPLEESNIITFIGSRGSGKTTAINEFCCLLRNYYRLRSNEKYDDIFHGSKKACRFHVLMPVDASVLGTGEDLIEVILASMYQEFQKKWENDRRQTSRETLYTTILQDFDEAYKDYERLGRHDEQIILGESVLVKLRNISSSLKTREAFGRLVTDLLKYLDEDGNGEEAYLVVVIDDLDMNPENGFEMLELLHKFLENRKIIILTAIKYEQMSMISKKHFIDCLIPKYGNVHADVYRQFQKEARKLSSDYLLKVLPLSNRIYLPERVQLDKNAKVAYEQSEERKWDIKQFVLMKTAEKMGIYYDAKGLKTHFCFPDTIRQLVNYNSFLDAMPSMTEIKSGQEGNIMELYDQNHERFNQDIEKRLAVQILNDEQLERFQLIIGRNIERRAEYAVNFMKQWSEQRAGNGQQCLRDDVDEQSYCYADLLEGIYKLGRENYDDKALVHCILASFTSEMTREYFSYIYNTEEDKHEKYVKRLRSFLGKSFGGKWFEQVIPLPYGKTTVQLPAEQKTTVQLPAEQKTAVQQPAEQKAAAQQPTEQEAADQKPTKQQKSIQTGYSSEVEMPEQTIYFEIEMSLDTSFVDRLTDSLSGIECAVMLLSDFKDEVGRQICPNWKAELNGGGTEDGSQITLTVHSHVVSATYDMFGFIGKELEAENTSMQLKQLEKAVVECAERYFAENPDMCPGMDKHKTLQDIKKKIKKEFDWGEREAFFPYYNLDLSYNVMKRVRRKIKKSIFKIEEIKTGFCNYFRKIYGYVAEYLQEEDKYYREIYENPNGEENGKTRINDNDKDKIPTFCEDFINAPFVRRFGYKEKLESESEKCWNEIFLQMCSIFSKDNVEEVKDIGREMEEHNMSV